MVCVDFCLFHLSVLLITELLIVVLRIMEMLPEVPEADLICYLIC